MLEDRRRHYGFEEKQRAMLLLLPPPLPASPKPPAPAGVRTVGSHHRKTPLERLRVMKPPAALPLPSLQPPCTDIVTLVTSWLLGWGSRALGQIPLLPKHPRALPSWVMDDGVPTQPAPSLQMPLDTSRSAAVHTP